MKHKIKVKVPIEKKGLFGAKTFLETRVIEVDDKTFREMKKKQKNRPFSIEEMMLYDDLFYDD